MTASCTINALQHKSRSITALEQASYRHRVGQAPHLPCTVAVSSQLRCCIAVPSVMDQCMGYLTSYELTTGMNSACQTLTSIVHQYSNQFLQGCKYLQEEVGQRDHHRSESCHMVYAITAVSMWLRWLECAFFCERRRTPFW
jgi:hypothetical protein